MQVIPVIIAPGTDSVMFLNIYMYVCQKQKKFIQISQHGKILMTTSAGLAKLCELG